MKRHDLKLSFSREKSVTPKIKARYKFDLIFQYDGIRSSLLEKKTVTIETVIRVFHFSLIEFPNF